MGVLLGLPSWGENRLRAFENEVMTKIFGPDRDEITEELKKLRNKELHNLHFSPNIVKVITLIRLRWTGHVKRMGEMRNTYRSLVRKT
jgi:hypothetical protein